MMMLSTMVFSQSKIETSDSDSSSLLARTISRGIFACGSARRKFGVNLELSLNGFKTGDVDREGFNARARGIIESTCFSKDL